MHKFVLILNQNVECSDYKRSDYAVYVLCQQTLYIFIGLYITKVSMCTTNYV